MLLDGCVRFIDTMDGYCLYVCLGQEQVTDFVTVCVLLKDKGHTYNETWRVVAKVKA